LELKTILGFSENNFDIGQQKVNFLGIFWLGLFRVIKKLMLYPKIFKFSDPENEKSKSDTKTDYQHAIL
jgi:hypothetical protein